MNIWRLNVGESQMAECIKSWTYAIYRRPKNPEIQKGDILLLQLLASDADKWDKRDSRIEFALYFDRYEQDYDGAISRFHWPNAGKTWPWILHCNAIKSTFPFSLEKLNLANNYSGETNPMIIKPEDVNKVMFYIIGFPSAEENLGSKIHKVLNDPAFSHREYNILAAIKNNDRIVESNPDQINWTTVPAHKEIKRNAELPWLLKELYSFKCQVCGYGFEKKYDVPYSETHHIIWLSRGGIDHSNNLIVVCPNHHRIIHEAKPKFDRNKLAFVYNNGLNEHLENEGHLKDPVLLQKVEQWAVKREEKIKKEKITL